jgi:hypothetical protein
VQPEHDGRDDPQRADRLVIARDHHLLDIFELVENLSRALEIPCPDSVSERLRVVRFSRRVPSRPSRSAT